MVIGFGYNIGIKRGMNKKYCLSMYNGILSSETGLSQPGFEHQYCSNLLFGVYVNEFQGVFRNQTCTVRLCQTEADPVTFLKDLNFLLCIKLNFPYGRVLKITQILRTSFIIPRQGLEGQESSFHHLLDPLL